MHEGTFLSPLTNAKVPVFIPCSTPSLCAFSCAMSPLPWMQFVKLTPDRLWIFETKRTRSPARRRCCGRLRMLTAPARSLGPGRRAAGRAESPCPCSSALVDGRHDGAITQHGRLQRHGNADLGRETRSGRGLEVASLHSLDALRMHCRCIVAYFWRHC